MIFLRRGDIRQALVMVEQAIRAGPGGVDIARQQLRTATRIAKVFVAVGAHNRAERELRFAIEGRKPDTHGWSVDFVLAHAMLAALFLEQGRLDECTQTLQLVRESVAHQRLVDPSPRTNEQLALIERIDGDRLMKAGDMAAAVESWEASLRLLAENPNNTIGADHHLIAGETLLRLGRPDAARRHAAFLIKRGWRWPDWVRRFSDDGR